MVFFLFCILLYERNFLFMKIKLLFFVFFIIIKSAFSQPLTTDEFGRSVNILERQLHLKDLQGKHFIVIDRDTVSVLLLYKNGYAVLSYKKEFVPLKAFSTEVSCPELKDLSLLIDMLKYDYSKQIEYNDKNKAVSEKNKILWQRFLTGNFFDRKFRTDTIGPLLTSKFGQVNCKDNHNTLINVTNYYTPHNYAVGCVALTFVTVLHYYKWPLQGQGYHSYTDDQGSSTGTYEADFGNTTYRWDLVQDEYYGVESTVESRQALGLAAFHCAVSVDMDFESGGSTSNINRIPYAASHFFRYDMPKYETSDASDFWDKLDSSLYNGNPVQLAVYTSSGAGHAIVCDGIIPTSDPSQRYYHLNMGWWGNSNGWYTIQSDFNAGGYSVIDAAVFQMLPVPQLNEVKYDLENNTAEISWKYSERIKNPVFELQQRVNGGDWQTVADNLTTNSFSFTPDVHSQYSFRVKTKQNSLWSEEKSFDPSKEAAKYEQIQLYPTLVKSKIKILYKDLRNAKVLFYNLDGKEVYSIDLGDYGGMEKVLNISFLKPQMYIVRVITADSQASFKIVYQGRVQ